MVVHHAMLANCDAKICSGTKHATYQVADLLICFNDAQRKLQNDATTL
jgi:hypothetical protein